MFATKHPSVSFEESVDEPPTEKEIVEYARTIGIDPSTESELMWIARDGITAPLPNEHWKPVESDDGSVYFFNLNTGVSSWEHPSDEKYRQLVKDERKILMSSTARRAPPVQMSGPKILAPLRGGGAGAIGPPKLAPLDSIGPNAPLAPLARPGTSHGSRHPIEHIKATSTTTGARPGTSHGNRNALGRSVPVDEKKTQLQADGAKFLKSTTISTSAAADIMQVDHERIALDASSTDESDEPSTQSRRRSSFIGKNLNESRLLDAGDLADAAKSANPSTRRTSDTMSPIKPKAVDMKTSAVSAVDESATAAEHKNHINIIRKRNADELAFVEEDCRDRLAARRLELQKQHSAELEKLKQTNQEKQNVENDKLKEELQKKHASSRAALIRQQEQELVDIRAVHEERLSKLKEENKDALAKETATLRSAEATHKSSKKITPLKTVATNTDDVKLLSPPQEAPATNHTKLKHRKEKIIVSSSSSSDFDTSITHQPSKAVRQALSLLQEQRRSKMNKVTRHSVVPTRCPIRPDTMNTRLDRLRIDLQRLNDRLLNTYTPETTIAPFVKVDVDKFIENEWNKFEMNDKRLVRKAIHAQGSTNEQLLRLQEWLRDYEKRATTFVDD